jgi:hypothetical protein
MKVNRKYKGKENEDRLFGDEDKKPLQSGFL